jgi:hypothetical protein
MTVQDVSALVTLMGLYLSEASGHQKAYKDLPTHIDDGHSLTLDKVQHEIIRFSRSHDLRAFALTHAGHSSVWNHSYPRCCDTRVGFMIDSKNLFIGQYDKLFEEYWLSPISYLSPYRG